MTKPSIKNLIRKTAKKGITVALALKTEEGMMIEWSNGRVTNHKRTEWAMGR